MIPSELVSLRNAMKMTQDDLGRETKNHRVTIAKYEAGTLAIPKEFEMAVFYLAVQRGVMELVLITNGDG